ncbi:autoinducer binding domain-containing protein [Pseudomonas purpurea]|uniref:autoinducer binding domain-containing protein n=1 Tax=Pseudomonas purpurea TaxID=3136737 RepID=UPI003266B812
MDIWREAQLKQLAHETKIESAYDMALNFVNNLGFEYCAFSITSLNCSHLSHKLRMNNYPHNWNTQYAHNNYEATDPLVAHCNQSVLPILWEDSVFSKAPELWIALQIQGLQHGWSQPVHDKKHGLCGMLSIARSHRAVSPYELYENLGYAVFISQKLHSLAVEKLQVNKPACHDITRLSPREIEVLKWSAEGKTAAVIATILNLTERTVNFHVNSSIKKLGVTNKISAVVRAAMTGVI